MTSRGILLGLYVFLLGFSGIRDAFADAYGTYNPYTGRIIFEADDVDAWGIFSISGSLTGPDDPIANGVLLAGLGKEVRFFPEFVSEGWYVPAPEPRHIFYDLGRIAQTHLPERDLYFDCHCPFNGPFSGYLIYIPEPSGGVMFLACSCVLSLIRWPLSRT